MHKLQLDGWSAWFVRPTLEQTCSFQCEKKKKKKYRVKKTSEWVWMAVSQASRTPGLGPDSSPPVGGKRPTAMEVAVGQRHLWLNTKIFWYGWKLLLEVFTKMPQQTDPRFKRSRSYNTVSYRGRAGGRAGTACQLSSPLRVLHPKKATSSSVLTMFVHGNPDFLFFLSTTCQHLLSAHCCGVFALHLLEVSCQSHGTGRSLTDSANEVWVSVSFAPSDCHYFSVYFEQTIWRKNT